MLVIGQNTLTLENMVKDNPLGMKKQIPQWSKMLHGTKQIQIRQITTGQVLIMRELMNQIQDITIIKTRQ